MAVLVLVTLAGCAALNMGWYKPGVTQQEFAQDKFACMNGSQMQVSTSNVNGTGSIYYGGGDVTCNTYGATTNCSGGGGYSQPGYVSGSSASYTTTNLPLFQACMQAHGYVWTSQAEVEKYEGPQQANATAPQDETYRDQRAQRRERAMAAQAKAAAAGISPERYADAVARCMIKAPPTDEYLCSELTASDVVASEQAATQMAAKTHP